MEEYEKYEKSHGRIERRGIKVATVDPLYFFWPNITQVFEISRTREIKGRITIEVVYGITSLKNNVASPSKLLELTRKHWEIENKLHHVRDVTFAEDACRVRHHGKAQILAAFRNTAITLLRHAGFDNILEAREVCAADKHTAIQLLFKRTE